MKICMVEPAKTNETGSIGTNFVVEAARSAGFPVDVINRESDSTGYDVEMVSIHHPLDYERFLSMPRRGKIRVVGGHITYNNPRPIIPFADFICMGDGETWIKEFLTSLSAGGNPAEEVAGTLECGAHRKGDPLPSLRYEKTLDNEPYLNRAGTRSAAWYIEIARGCPFSCDYCELGNSMPYRFRDKHEIINQIENLDLGLSRKIVFFAPDEASHPAYNDLLKAAKDVGIRQCFGSYRIDQVLRSKGLFVEPNQLVRVGIDGLTESTRTRVGKILTNRVIYEYFDFMISQGHVNFKVFQMFAHPWEKLSDFNEWAGLMERIRRLPLKKNVSLRVKWTPLIPQPSTPLKSAHPRYSFEMVKKIKDWHKTIARPNRSPGFYIGLDGIMSERAHRDQINLTRGDEDTFQKAVDPF